MRAVTLGCSTQRSTVRGPALWIMTIVFEQYFATFRTSPSEKSSKDVSLDH